MTQNAWSRDSSGIEAFIDGSSRLTDVFGYWPSFHDAEVIDLHLWRGDVDPDKGSYVFPVLTVKLHNWELTDEVDSQGHYVLRRHTLSTLRFHGVFEFQMVDFNQQNVLFGLVISRGERSEGQTPVLVVEFRQSFGMDAKFSCLRVEVVDASPCTKEGIVSASGDERRDG